MYELPWYTQEQYYIGRQRGSVFLGGRNQVTVTLYLVRFTIYFDFWASKLTFENYFSYDLLGTTGAICLLGNFFNDILRAQIYWQADYKNCAYGVLGIAAQSDHQVCEWQTYYVNKPIFDFLLASESTSEIYRGEGCEPGPVPRYDA